MANKMLIDAAHPEETRVVVVKGTRVEEFDYESALRKQLRGNIYLAKVTRVEPSLQAAFVDYGGNRHGFLAFSEIHPDYYQIPVADRQALLAEEAEAAKSSAAAEDDDGEDRITSKRRRRRPARKSVSNREDDVVTEEVAAASEQSGPDVEVSVPDEADEEPRDGAAAEPDSAPDPSEDESEDQADAVKAVRETDADGDAEDEADPEDGNGDVAAAADGDVESVGSEDALEELPVRTYRRLRSYKIQEVIKRRQIILVQVVKEERGNKGAALTTYLSIAGRYAVLMPNTARGGGISRKITNAPDRKRLRNIAAELSVPDGMGVIIRTAGAARTKTEIKRDFEYLLRLWENVRDLTLQSSAPALVYEEGSIIKRSIRDLYSKDIDEVLVAGDNAYKEAKGFMRMLMPSHAKNVQPYREPEPVFIRFQVERQLNAMFNPQVTLKSGGYVVINQTEALVSVDVNSGKATREHNIEDTALKTNMEAAEEIARQLRLRDLAGLIVIDFIDMDERRNNRSVERKLKECLRSDRARIQVGRISHFGLLEMSRQRLRVGVLEDNTSQCPFCKGTGIVRSTESVGLFILRSLEDTLITDGPHDLTARTSSEVALYILNQKRSHLRDIEHRYGMTINVLASDQFHGTNFAIEKSQFRSPVTDDDQFAVQLDWALIEGEIEQEESESESDADPKRSRKRRRRRKPRSDAAEVAAESEQGSAEASDEDEADSDAETAASGELPPKRPRRRGRRGGRRARASAARRRSQDGEDSLDEPISAESEAGGGANSEHEPLEEPNAPPSMEGEALDLPEETAKADGDFGPSAGNGLESEPIEITAGPPTEHDLGGQSEGETSAPSEPAPDTVSAEHDVREDEPSLEPESTEAAEEPEPKTRRRGWWQRRTGLGG